jgi:hypothetical protein
MNLPPCLARRWLGLDSPVYFCAHPEHHSPNHLVSPEMCLVCPLWQQAPPAHFRPPPPGGPPRPRGPCMHLGEPVGWRDCPSCGGSVRLKVFACAHPAHGEATLGECGQCPDHAPRPEPAAVGSA